MKRLFYALLIANLAMLSFMQVRKSASEHAINHIAQLGVEAVKIRIVGHGEYAAARAQGSSAVNPAMAQSPEACLEWGPFSPQDRERAAAAMSQIKVAADIVEQKAIDSYWVYIPRIATKPDADRLAADLRIQGETDFTVSRDAVANTYYISLGVYQSEEGANRRLDRVRQLGISTATIAPRAAKNSRAFLIREPADAAVAAKLAEVAEQFPGTKIRPSSCNLKSG